MQIRNIWTVYFRHMRKVRSRETTYTYLSLRISLKVCCAASHFWRMIYFQFCSSLRFSFVSLSLDYRSYISKCEPCTTYREIYVSCDSRHKSLSWEKKGNERIDITRKWRIASLKPFVKTDRWFRAKNCRNCYRLPIALKGNRNFATSCLKTLLALFDLFSLVHIAYMFSYLIFRYLIFRTRQIIIKCQFYINDLHVAYEETKYV